MEMCVDNPRSGFTDLFATHPSIDARVKALVDYAGGHDPGPLALPDIGEAEMISRRSPDETWSDWAGPQRSPPPTGPWGPTPGQQQGGTSGEPWGAPPDAPAPGPWGPRRG